jgi:hypothetical protein
MRKLLVLAFWTLPAMAAAESFGVLPAKSPDLLVRYNHGAPVLISVMPHGIVQISPIKSRIDGRLQLSVVAYNSGPGATNLGYENIRISTADGASLELYSYDHLKHEANKRATISRIGLVVSAAVNGYVSGRESGYSPTAAAIDRRTNEDDEQAWEQRIQDKLDTTMEHLDGDVLQTTTIDPGEAAGGEVVAAKPKFNNGLSPRFDMTVNFNGETHLISFYAAKEGAAVPAADEYIPTSAADLKSLMSAPETQEGRPAATTRAAAQGPSSSSQQQATQASRASRSRRAPGLVILGGEAQ